MEDTAGPSQVSADVTALGEASAEIEQLTAALQSRTVIGYAVGIVMVRQSSTAEAAFSHLVELSSHTNVKLREIASQVVAEADRRAVTRPTPWSLAGVRATG